MAKSISAIKLQRQLYEKITLSVPYGEHHDTPKELAKLGFAVRISFVRQDGKMYIFLADRKLKDETGFMENVKFSKILKKGFK